MEYGEMMRQFRRFCASQEEIAEQAGTDFQCEGCPLERNSVCDKLPCAVKPEDVERVERVVEKWAEEHPEPVYPTWAEWLTDLGAIPKAISWDEPLVEAVYDALQEHIPAKFAEKLRIEPKEG